MRPDSTQARASADASKEPAVDPWHRVEHGQRGGFFGGRSEQGHQPSPEIGHCRISVAEPAELAATDDPRSWSHVRVATKYPNLTRKHFAARGVQAECVKLNGAMEIAPLLGLSSRIVDLVSSGKTLKENGLVEVEKIAEVSARLVANRAAFKTDERIASLVEKFRAAVNA